MATRDQIVDVYRAILRRKPESEQAIQQWVHVPGMSELMEVFLASEDYKIRFQEGRRHDSGARDASLSWPGCAVETEQEQDTLAQLFAHIRDDWTALGASEPYYSVLSTPENLRASFSDVDGFLDSGRRDIERLTAFAERAGVDLPRRGTCLELGCGVGRLTAWLSATFSRVIAVDISQSHLDIAQSNLARFEGTRQIEFHHLADPVQLRGMRNYDMFFSVIVLQHNPPPVMAFMLDTILGGLNSGGFAYFQVPTYKLGYSFGSRQYLDALSGTGEMEMHVLPQAEIFRIAEQTGCTMLEVREDDYTGHSDGISNTFFLWKREQSYR